jgi:glucosamine--fructose-6-phosphate aminotransferase (isomerizing)
MCGVIGLVCEHHRNDMGLVAAELLKTLEYRGYDSTGAAIQGERSDDVALAKGVGAPSAMVDELGITKMAGSIFCGQVRWATFGAVTRENSQPHVVRCKAFLYGAHNGNVTNCDDLKSWLVAEGHAVLSDNDGEMVVHTVEHFFARELARAGAVDADGRRKAMRDAIVAAAAKLEGSYAAVIVDPLTRTLWAIKQGSSLYFGMGHDAAGAFNIASSDLSSVLKRTRVVLPITEGEMVEYQATRWQIHAVEDRVVKTPTGSRRYAAGEPIAREPVRSRLRAKDTALVPPFETFMDQEISAQEKTARDVITLFLGGTDASRAVAGSGSYASIERSVDALRDQTTDDALRAHFHALVDLPAMAALLDDVPEAVRRAHALSSSEAGFLADLLPMARGDRDVVAVRLLDALLEAEEAREWAAAVERFGVLCQSAEARGGRIYVMCCGSSFHAAKAAALYFNDLAHLELLPILPGEFRGQVSQSMRDGDLVVAVSQSGETKDLIDVLNDVIASGKDIAKVALVNNVNSTLAQEKADVVIPLRCGPEIAVPATKSFINQMVVFYCLALHVARVRGEALGEVEARRERLRAVPALIHETIAATDADLEVAAQLLFLRPSMHILATRIAAVAKEGALKIREVVLNHTEGFEASEFKHGPNTLLGFNTVLGPLQIDAMLKRLGRGLADVVSRAAEVGLGPTSLGRIVQAAHDMVLSPTAVPFGLSDAERLLLERCVNRAELVDELYADYPLVYVTGPDERDVALTVSQINTHKIRGACTVVVAEDHPALRGAAAKAPVDNPEYRSVYVTLPRTHDTLLATFSSTVALQRLALKMSLLKKRYLDRLGIADHGVHPDVPKNVSKSITVD